MKANGLGLIVCASALLSLNAAGAIRAVDGELDPGFGGDGTSSRDIQLDSTSGDLARAIAVQRDGRVVVVVGSATDDDGEVTKAVALRVRSDGSADPGFGSAGVFALDFSSLGLGYLRGVAWGVAIDGAGRAVVVGELEDGGTRRPLIFRLTPAGALDATFFGDGVVVGAQAGVAQDVAVDRSSGVVWVIGTTASKLIWVWRWQGGSPAEASWFIQNAEEHEGRRILIQPDGKAILAGSWLPTGTSDFDLFVVRLTATGDSADPTFGTGGLVSHGFDVAPPDFDDDHLLDVDLDSRGRIVVLAEAEIGPGTFDSASDLGFLRLTSAGLPDADFDGDGSRLFDFLGGSARDAWYEGGIAAQGDGRIVVGVTPGSSPFSVKAGALRLLEDGSLDLPFGGGGTGRIAVDLEPDGGPGDERCGFAGIVLEAGRLVGAGGSEWSDPDFDFGFARLSSALIFGDGFEIGSSYFWSVTTP